MFNCGGWNELVCQQMLDDNYQIEKNEDMCEFRPEPLIDENEVTLKKFRSFKNSIALEPSNKNFKTRIFGEGRVRIQGKLVGLIRKF